MIGKMIGGIHSVVPRMGNNSVRIGYWDCVIPSFKWKTQIMSRKYMTSYRKFYN
jgi:hypothetical protein